MPMPLTSLTIVKIFSNPLFLPARSLHAAPMQNRVEPLALALRAASSTGSMSTRRDALVGVLYEEDWEQYLQFSLHPPATSQPSPSTAHLSLEGQTFDVHQGAELDTRGVVVHTMHRGLGSASQDWKGKQQ